MDPRQYADLRVREARLKMSRSVSAVLSRALAAVLLIIVLGIVLGLVAVVLIQWLNGLLGAPWGSLAVLGLFIVVLLVLWLLRKRLFRGFFINILTGDGKIHSMEELDREILRVDSGIDSCHAEMKEFCSGLNSACGIARTGLKIGSALIAFLKKNSC